MIHTRGFSKALPKPNESFLITSTFKLTKWKISMARGIRKQFSDWRLSRNSSRNWRSIVWHTMLVRFIGAASLFSIYLFFRKPKPHRRLFQTFPHILWNRRITESRCDSDKAKCLKRYADSKNYIHLINGGKYCMRYVPLIPFYLYLLKLYREASLLLQCFSIGGLTVSHHSKINCELVIDKLFRHEIRYPLCCMDPF